MASRRKKKVVTVASEVVSDAPAAPGSLPPQPDHKHLYVPVGAIRDGEFMEQCSICADMRRV